MRCVHRKPVGFQFLCDHGLVYRAKIDTPLILHHRIDVGAIQKVGEKPYVIHIQLQQVLLLGLLEGELRIAYGLDADGLT